MKPFSSLAFLLSDILLLTILLPYFPDYLFIYLWRLYLFPRSMFLIAFCCVFCVRLQQPENDQWAIEGFYIYYGPFDEQQIDYQRQMVLGSSVRHAVLTHLDENVAYSIRMQSYTAAGTLSQFSNTVVKQTLGTCRVLCYFDV